MRKKDSRKQRGAGGMRKPAWVGEDRYKGMDLKSVLEVKWMDGPWMGCEGRRKGPKNVPTVATWTPYTLQEYEPSAFFPSRDEVLEKHICIERCSKKTFLEPKQVSKKLGTQTLSQLCR